VADVDGDSCSILMSASTTQETIFPPARKCSQMVSYSLPSYARSYPFPQVDACVPIIEFKEKIGIEAILVPEHNLEYDFVNISSLNHKCHPKP
jgi:hypothetical protein